MIENILINGYPLNNPPESYIVELSDSTSADVELNTYNRGGRDGVVLGNALYRAYSFTIGLKIVGNNPDQLRVNKDRIMTQIRLKNYGTSRYKTVTFKFSNGTERWCEAVLSKMPQGEIKPETSYAVTPLTFQMTATRSYLFGTYHDTAITTPNYGGMSVPMNVPMSMANDPESTTGQIINAGNTDSQPKFHITGPFTAVDIQNLTTGQQLTVTKTVAAGEYIDLDDYSHSAFLNGSTNIRGSVTGDWPLIAPGVNTIVFSPAGSTAATAASVSYYDAYTGI